MEQFQKSRFPERSTSPNLEVRVLGHEGGHLPKAEAARREDGTEAPVVRPVEQSQPVDGEGHSPRVQGEPDAVGALGIANVGQRVGALRDEMEPMGLAQVARVEAALVGPPPTEVRDVIGVDGTRVVLVIGPRANRQRRVEEVLAGSARGGEEHDRQAWLPQWPKVPAHLYPVAEDLRAPVDDVARPPVLRRTGGLETHPPLREGHSTVALEDEARHVGGTCQWVRVEEGHGPILR